MWNKIINFIKEFIENILKPKENIIQIIPPVHISRIIDWAKAIEIYENANKKWNNPGAIRNLDGDFMKFPTHEAGFAYLCDYLTRCCTGKHKAYPRGGETTLLQFQNIYSPAIDQNNPLAYALFIANKLGIKIDEKIKILL